MSISFVLREVRIESNDVGGNGEYHGMSVALIDFGIPDVTFEETLKIAVGTDT